MTGLRLRQAPVFWAVGPDGYSLPHLVAYRTGEVVELIEDAEALQYKGPIEIDVIRPT